jgi:putative transposase
MLRVLWLAFGSLLRIFRNRRDLIFENFVLRQQLAVLKRRRPRPALNLFDKLFWVAISRLWLQWKQALIVVSHETVVRWHRVAFACIGG